MNVRKPIDYSGIFQSIGKRRIHFIQENAMTLLCNGSAKFIFCYLTTPP